jgi:Protein of unknown function (DUF3999)
LKLYAVLLLFVLAPPSPELRYFRYERPIESLPQDPGQTCLVLEPAIFAHAAPGLSDLRLYRGSTETPYVIQMAAPVAASMLQIAPLNLGRRAGQTVFDLAMPAGSYSDLQLAITGHDFIATVTVSGSQAQASAQTRIGSYTIFDLTRQRLGRSTVLHLPESDFRFLHFRIAGPIAPENVSGLSVGRLPTSEPKYLTVAETSQSSRKGRDTVIEFNVPSRTPVDRIVLVPGTEPASFSRNVKISASSISQQAVNDAAVPPSPVVSFGSLLRVHRVQDGHRIDEERLSVNPPSTAFDTPSKWTITIENGDDSPIQLVSVRLEMLERSLCFEASGTGGYMLYSGDSALAAPKYDYAALYMPQSQAAKANAGPEKPNPDYQDRPDSRPFTERHPVLLWLGLAFAILLLGVVALRSAKLTAQTPS